MLDDLDRAIDEVAREITSGSLNPDFARRVSVRIGDADAIRGPRVWSRIWLVVTATACVGVLALFVIRQVQSPGSVQPTPQSPSSIQLEPDATVATAGVAPATASAAAVTTAPRPGPGRGGPGPAGTSRAGARSVAMPRDPDFEPLATAPIEMESLDLLPLSSVVPIEIEAIAIERIEIAAMP